MNWFLSILIGFLTAAGGCLTAGYIAVRCVKWYRISSFEGGSGYYVVFIGLFGIVVGLVLGLVCARLVANGAAPGFLKALGVSFGSLAALGLVVLGLCRLAADLPPTIDSRELAMAIEVRTPVGFKMPVELDEYGAFAGVDLRGGRSQPTEKLRLDEARKEDGRWVVPATFPLQTSSSDKLIRAYFNKANDAIISVRFGTARRKHLEWSEWYESAWNAGESRPAPEHAFFIRYRVQLVEKKIRPPQPTHEELELQRAAAEEAEFNALSPSAPIVEWFRYTQCGTPPERLGAAVHHIVGRENFVAELSSLIRSDDAETARNALYLFEHLPQVPAELVPPVADVGRKIAAAITAFNATTPEQDPSYQGAADISLQFSPWMVAVRAIRKQGCGDLTPELRTILELSRARPDSHCMQADVRRVASYYMHEWTGLAPLPGDPKPNG